VTFHRVEASASGLELPPVTKPQPDDRDGDASDHRHEYYE
jgi:hypothetical protein